MFPSSYNQRNVTITVILMSTLFVVCNSAYYGYLFSLLSGLGLAITTSLYQFVLYITVFGTVLPILNAAINPIIIISRGTGMRKRFTDASKRFMKSIRGQEATFASENDIVTEHSGILD
jgi:hypothetical protein